ncbi:high affinity immunoglobulin alpha and immunoglobulin mu Fc receptor [Trichechus manatus latirostris]|uniref:high affinity immunoglobulin alpha and immunoglobulin mu Fc receptor n=1 Tax=Trichechus manatus latirostris TaxID=127582 RepID=UPI000C9FFDDD|nr:high affinity immunoglobulin alpha and immunoglobulin mu Fc receptor [Trichechus manatus latirostris]
MNEKKSCPQAAPQATGRHQRKGKISVTNQSAGWKMPLLLTLCLLQAANALKGPRLVSGEPGGAVDIKCHYTSTSVNRHQRKYWCRLRPPKWICHTIVSTNHYTHLRYHGRVALEDFPQSSLFVVRLFQLSPADEGYYRCGIGNRNDMFYFSVNLTVSAGPSSTITTATPAASKLITRSLATASPVANRWTPGTTRTIEGQGTGWDRVVVTPGTSKTTASAKGGHTPGIIRAVAPRTGSWVEGSIRATVLSPESRASKLTVTLNTTEDVWVWGTTSSVANKARVSEEARKTTPKVDGPTEETRRVTLAPDATRNVTGIIRPSALVSEKWAWETLRKATSVSKQPALGSTEETTPAADVWTLGTTSIEMATEEGSTEGDLASTANRGPQATSSQVPAAGRLRLHDKGSSVKSSLPEEKSVSQVLPPVSTVLPLVVLLALALLQRKLWRKKFSQEAEKATWVTLIQMLRFWESSSSPDQLPHMERKMLQDGSCHTRVSLPIAARDPRP